MESLKKKISSVQEDFIKKITESSTIQEVEKVRVEFVGRSGKVSEFFSQLKKLSQDEKRVIAPLLNSLKETIELESKKAKEFLIVKREESARLKKKNFDVSAYKTGLLKGHVHPYSQIVERIENIFLSMGYDILDGPFVENDFYNFTSLNIPQDHPARDMYDTFWLNKKNLLLRTHTSTMQVKTMEQQKPPIAAVVPGYTFRHEAVDASHDTMFMQCEGFLIDKNVTLSHLFATAQEFLKALFEKSDLDIRVRPGFFPFVEPGVEIDMRCPFCEKGCSVCKKTTWIEIFPGGLIHPNVIKAGGLDPEEYSGFAFGFGLTRLAMIKYEIDDIRLLLGGKFKFLEQF